MKINRYLERLGSNWPVKILALAVALLLFFFNQIISLDETVISVALQVDTPEHLAVAEEYVDAVRVRARGDEEMIRAVSASDFLARVRATDITQPGEYRLPVQIERRSSARDLGPLELLLEPDSIRVVLDTRVRETVQVVPVVQGFPARGYELVRSFVTPAEVTIEGPGRYVEGRETVGTEPVDLSGRTGSFSTRLALRPPNPFIEVVGGATIEYRAVFQPQIVRMTFESLEVTTRGLFPGLTIAGIQERPSVELQGPLLSVEALTDTDIDASIDLSLITTPGTYTVPVEVSVPEGVSLLQTSPAEITIEITGFDPDDGAGESQ